MDSISEPDDRVAIDILTEQLHLTLRQSEVLHWIAEGKTNDEIATIIACSVNTVKAHLKDIFKRLGLHSRTAAAACAYRAHLRHSRSRTDLPERASAPVSKAVLQPPPAPITPTIATPSAARAYPNG